MSSSETTKKRKAVGHQGGVECESNAATGEGGTTLAAILAEMKDMKSEMKDMRGRLSRMDELESKCQIQEKNMDKLESKCKMLEVRCASLEGSVKILTKENKWEYSAPYIPTSHWIDHGFVHLDVDYIPCMEYLLKQMKDRAIELRSGRNIQNDIFLNGGIDDDNDETILLHDDILLPHWKEFANALQLYQNSGGLPNFHIFNICNVQLTSSVIALLTQAVKGKAIFKSFALVRNEFVNVREGIDFAVKLVEDNPNLERFDWVDNEIESTEDARYLVNAITTHPHIDDVRLENCFGEDIDGYEILRSLVTSGKSFAHIDLEGNNIRTGGGTEISDYLAANPTLKELFLAGNHLDDNDALLISHALRRNTNLQRLRLGRNDITYIGREALLNAIYDSTSLNSVSDCNHSCFIECIGLFDIPNNDNNRGSKVNRARKIYHLLSKRNREGSNVQHLNSEFEDEDDDSLALVPRVLESVYRYSRNRQGRHPVHPLSIMYEILRSWEMPALYENCGMEFLSSSCVR